MANDTSFLSKPMDKNNVVVQIPKTSLQTHVGWMNMIECGGGTRRAVTKEASKIFFELVANNINNPKTWHQYIDELKHKYNLDSKDY